MSEFYSGRGPLRTTMHVINAAKMISECGSKLNKLAKDIAAQVNHKNSLIKKKERSKFIFLIVC